MIIPKARKLASGIWYIQLRLGGQSVSVKATTKKEVEQQARLLKSQYAAGVLMQPIGPGKETLDDAYTAYIESKRGVLSPSTISGYERLQKNSFQGIMKKPLRSITNAAIQKEVSAMATAGKSPKSIANAVGLLSAVLRLSYTDFRLSVTTPQREHIERIEPKESDITAIFEAVKGKSVELPTLLAMWMGLRMSEILGLTWDCIDGNKMHIRQAKVDEGVKGTKTYGSTRTLTIPPYIADLIAKQPHKSEYVVPLSRRTVYEFFQKYTSRAGIQHYRFHDLRHLNTTVQLLLGIDNKTITKRNGWTTDAMIKAVYGHTSEERIDLAAEVIDDYFANKLLTSKQQTL